MYHPNQSLSSRRAGEDFLRRMAQNDAQPQKQCALFSQQTDPRCSCNPPQQGSCMPSKNPQMPSLAMVYAPIQEWTCLMETPEDALHHGTLFHELFKPFEGSGFRRSCKG